MRKELLAGLTTFFTASYLIVLYPKILSEGGMDLGSAITATILTIFLASVSIGLYANFPALLVPGLSIGPYLVYSVILKHGSSWQNALGLVFWAGIIIFLLSIFKVRQKLLIHLPSSIKSASIAGIGLFLIAVGIKNTTLLSIEPITTPNMVVLFGLALFFTLYYFKVSAAFLITILTCWMIAVFTGFSVLDGVFSYPSPINPTFMQLDFLSPLKLEWLGTLLSITLICLFDTSVAITVLSKLAKRIDNKGRVKNLDDIVIPDGPCSSIGAILGTGTLTFAIESAAGINVGGRTKITAITAALCMLVCLFLYPLISTIPLFVTTPILIAIGCLMAKEMQHIRWNYLTESLPAIIILVTIPITFSIYLGFALGFLAHALIKALEGKWKEVHPVCWTLALIFAAHLSWAIATSHF